MKDCHLLEIYPSSPRLTVAMAFATSTELYREQPGNPGQMLSNMDVRGWIEDNLADSCSSAWKLFAWGEVVKT